MSNARDDAERLHLESIEAWRTWLESTTLSREDPIVPDDLAAALDERPGAREQWDSLPPTARRTFLLWIVTAKRAETRSRRVTESAELIEQGRRLEERVPDAM